MKGLMMDYQKITYTVEEGIAVIAMACKENLNALDMQMGAELLDAIRNAETNDEVFESGEPMDMAAMMEKNSIITDKLKKMDKLVITSVAGSVAGAGVSLALSGDFMICADNAKFILAFVNLGLVPDMGLTYLLSKTIGPARTMDLAVTGRPVDVAEFYDWGLVQRMVPADILDEETMKFARKLVRGPLVAYKNIKKQIYTVEYAEYLKWITTVEVPTQCECAATQDFREGVYAFIEKRRAAFAGE